MEKMTEKMSVDNRTPPREHQEPQIRNPNFRRLVAQQNRPREPRHHDENNQSIRDHFSEN